MCILRVLLISIFYFNVKSLEDNNSSFKIFDDILNLLRNFKVCNKQLASYFIVKCCSHADLNSYSKQLFHYCQESNIPLSSEAVNAFCEVEKSKEVPLPDLLSYLRYIKLVCQKKIPKDLLNLALEKCETSMFADMHHICELLHSISVDEVEESCLVKFLQLCCKESMWQYVAEMFIIWGSKNHLSLVIHSALATDFENVGKYFRKLANYVHGKEGSLSTELIDKFSLELKCTFGQIGIALMLKSFSKGDLDNALEILHTLHMYNVNYYKLELAVENSDFTDYDSKADNFTSKIFPFYVVFVAVDICLQLNRPKDALTIFQDCCWLSADNVDEDVQTYIGKERCERLLKLVPLLNSKDSLDEGWDALEKLLTAIKQDSSLEFVQENAKSLGRIYDEYMINLLNSERISLAYILYQYSLGPSKDLFTVSSDVLRGLIVAFAKDGRYAAVKSLLLIGIMKKIYPVQKPKLETFPWEITLMTHWTVIEIEVVVEWYTEILFPLLKNKTKETFEKWFSVKIVFNITAQNSSKVECLNEAVTDSKYYIIKTRNALQSMNPPLEVTEITKENALCITSKSLYNFWKNRCPDAANFDMQFVKSQNKFSFGASEKGSKERNSSKFVQEFFSPKSCEEYKHQTSDQPSQYNSPHSPATSPDSLFSMTNEAKTSSSRSTQLATTPEKTPPTKNIRNSLSPRANAVYGNENNSELPQPVLLPHHFQFQNDSPNVCFKGNKSPRQYLESSNLSVASTNQSYNENTSMSYNSSNSFRSNLNSLPLLPTPNQSTSLKNCFNRSNSNDNSFTENKSIEDPNTLHPSTINDNVSNEPIISEISNPVIKRTATSAPHKIGLKKRKIITFIKTPVKPHKTVFQSKVCTAKTKINSKMVGDISKKDLTSQFTINNETASNSAETTSLKTDDSVMNRTLLNAHFVKSSPASVSNASYRSSQLIPINKKNRKIIKKDEFRNVIVCVTSKARTINISSNQSLSALEQSVPNNNDKRISGERSRVSFQNRVPIFDQNSSTPPKNIQSHPGMIRGGQKSSVVKPSTSFQTPNSDAQICMQAGSKTQISCENYQININRNLENPAVLSHEHAANQNFTIAIQNECKTNAVGLSNVNVRTSKSYSTGAISNSSMNQHPPVLKQNYKINLANNLENKDKASLLALPCNSKSVSPKLFDINQQRQPVNELNKPQTVVINTSPNQSGNMMVKNKIALTRTVNLNRVTNTDTEKVIQKNNIVNKPSFNTITPQTSKPVIKRADFKSTLNNFYSWQDEHGSASTESNERNEDKKFQLNKIPVESSQRSRPFSGGASCRNEDFKKIEQFLKIKIVQKNKCMGPKELEEKASSLAKLFIQNNNKVITKLDKKTMKLLLEFAELNV